MNQDDLNRLKRFAVTSSGALAALAALPAGATVIRVDGLNQLVSANVPLALDVNADGQTDVTLQNTFSYAGMDYYGSTYYDRRVSGDGSIGPAPVAPGTLIGPGSTFQNPATWDSTSASFVTQQVGTGVYYESYNYPCGNFGKYTCTGYNTVYYPIYGTIGHANVNDSALGSDLLFGFSFLSGSQTDYGWFDLAIQDNGTQSPYAVTLKGYGYDTSGLAVAAGAAASATVPEPGTLGLAALWLGALGLIGYRRGRNVRGASE